MRVSITLPNKVPPSSYTPKEIFTTKKSKIKNILFKRLLDLHPIDYLAQKVYIMWNSYFSYECEVAEWAKAWWSRRSVWGVTGTNPGGNTIFFVPYFVHKIVLTKIANQGKFFWKFLKFFLTNLIPLFYEIAVKKCKICSWKHVLFAVNEWSKMQEWVSKKCRF